MMSRSVFLRFEIFYSTFGTLGITYIIYISNYLSIMQWVLRIMKQFIVIGYNNMAILYYGTNRTFLSYKKHILYT